MTYPTCPYCGERVDNLMLHFPMCKVLHPPRAPAKATATKEAPMPIIAIKAAVEATGATVEPENIILVEPKRTGRPAKYDRCTICGDKHFSKGLCAKHYMASRRSKK